MLTNDQLEHYAGRYMSMIYHVCANTIGEEFALDPSAFNRPTGKGRFYAAVEALRVVFAERSQSFDYDDSSSDEAAGRWQLDDVAPRRVHLEFLEFCKDRRKALKAEGRSEVVYRYRDVARAVFDRIGVDFCANENTRINVVNGNFDRMVAYMDEVIEGFDWIDWHGRGVRIDTRKVRITA